MTTRMSRHDSQAQKYLRLMALDSIELELLRVWARDNSIACWASDAPGSTYWQHHWNQQNKRHIERACARQLQPIGLVCLSVGLSIARPCFCTQFIYSIERINIHLLIDSFIHSACRACFIQCIVVVVVFKSLPTLDCSWIFYSLVDVSHVSPVFFTI